MPKPDRIVVVTGDQQPDMDVASLARVIVRFARQRRPQPESVETPTPDSQLESA